MIKKITKSAEETRLLGKKFALGIRSGQIQRSAIVIGLEGDLGGGKTTFLQGFTRGLGIKEKILSPTFVIMKRFPLLGSKFYYFYHIDCYRIDKPKEILELGFKKIISDPKNIVAVEWSERIKKVLVKGIILIKFKFINKNKREITF